MCRAKAAKNKIVFDDDGNQEDQEEESDDDFNIEDASARLRQGNKLILWIHLFCQSSIWTSGKPHKTMNFFNKATHINILEHTNNMFVCITIRPWLRYSASSFV